LSDQDNEPIRVKVWDWPTRLIHWALVVLIFLAWYWAEVDVKLHLHKLAGLTVLGLLVFRIYWGFAGAQTARFANFVRGPKESLAYAKRLISGPTEITPGHTPIGGYSVVALLLLLVVQVVLGLFAVDTDYLDPGPLSFLISSDLGLTLAEVHELTFNVLLGFIVLHLLAVLYYVFVKRNNIVAAMIGGWKRFPRVGAPVLAFATPVRLIIGIVLALAIAYGVGSAEKVAGLIGI